MRGREFDNLGVFTFSDEEGTTSFDLPDRVPQPREGAPQAAADVAAEEDLRPAQPGAGSGSGSRCWSRGPTRTPTCCSAGRLATQAPEIDGMVLLNDGTRRAGAFVTAEITEAHPYDLVARIV